VTDEDNGKDAKNPSAAPKANATGSGSRKTTRAVGSTKSAGPKRAGTKRTTTKTTKPSVRSVAASAKGADVKTPNTETSKAEAAKAEAAKAEAAKAEAAKAEAAKAEAARAEAAKAEAARAEAAKAEAARAEAAKAEAAKAEAARAEAAKAEAAKAEAAKAEAAKTQATAAAASMTPPPSPIPSSRPPSSPPPVSQAPEPWFSGKGGIALIASVVAVVLALTTPQWGPTVWDLDEEAESDSLANEQASLKQTVEALQARIEELSSAQGSLARSIGAVKLPGMLIVAKSLREDLGTNKPFAENLNLLRAIVGDDEQGLTSVFALDDWAEIGVPLDAELRDSFDNVAHAIVAADQMVESNGDLAQKMSETMASLSAVTTRLRWKLDGAPSGDGPIATVARAEALVATLAFNEAVEQLQTLPDDLQALTTDWVAAVKARAALNAAREDLDVYVIEAIARTR